MGTFEKYVKEHCASWVAFAREKGHGDLDPVLVTGVDRTKDFAMLCYSNDNDDLRCEFITPAPGSDSNWGTWHKTGFVHTNLGPQSRSTPFPTSVAGSTFPSNGSIGYIPDEYNQCVFVRYYTVRKRLGVPRIIKAGAGPHDPSGGEHDNDRSPLELPYYDSGPGSDSDAQSSVFGSDGNECRRSVTSTETVSETESDIVVHNVPAVC